MKTKKTNPRKPAATPAEMKRAAAKSAKVKGNAKRTETATPPAAFGKVKAAAERAAADPAVARFCDWLSEIVKPTEPNESEIERVRAALAGALGSGTAGMFPSFARLAKQKTSKVRERAEIVRKVARWIHGSEPLPDGVTQADVVLRGVAWDGWEWSLRGIDVSRATADEELENEFVNAEKEAETLRRVEKEAGELIAWAACNGTSPRDNPVTAAREAAEEYFAALNDEDGAWCELAAAEKNARATLPVSELAAAKARLDGRPISPPTVPPPTVPTASPSNADAADTENRAARAALRRAKRDAVAWWRKKEWKRLPGENDHERWVLFCDWVRTSNWRTELTSRGECIIGFEDFVKIWNAERRTPTI